MEYPIHKTGQIVKVYQEPEDQKELIGTAELLQFRSVSLPFTLEDNSLSKDLNKVYVLERWLAKMVSTFSDRLPLGYTTIISVRVLYTVGQKTIYSTEPSPIETNSFQDSFKIVEGIDTSYWASRVDGSELNSEAF